ncbi:DUF6509 family protein [Niallia sp. 01092]|uniref:DUF6509 family protein n=1 Tax=unclassified Niallia TaxID=2837522 RepID=UPI003FD065BE
MKIMEYTVEKLNDPTGILTGDRFEYFLQIELDEEDELSTIQGLQLKVLFFVEGENSKILNYHFYNSMEDKYLDFELDEEELDKVFVFCKEHYQDI